MPPPVRRPKSVVAPDLNVTFRYNQWALLGITNRRKPKPKCSKLLTETVMKMLTDLLPRWLGQHFRVHFCRCTPKFRSTFQKRHTHQPTTCAYNIYLPVLLHVIIGHIPISCKHWLCNTSWSLINCRHRDERSYNEYHLLSLTVCMDPLLQTWTIFRTKSWSQIYACNMFCASLLLCTESQLRDVRAIPTIL